MKNANANGSAERTFLNLIIVFSFPRSFLLTGVETNPEYKAKASFAGISSRVEFAFEAI